MLILVRYAVYSAGRVTGQYSHLGCWLAVEMVIDGRLRQGKALISKLEIQRHTLSPWAAWRARKRFGRGCFRQPPLFSFFATSGIDEVHFCHQ